MLLRQIFDPKLAQYAYLFGCQRTGEALVIDPERDIDLYIQLAYAEGLRIIAVAETHIHADFLSGAREFASQLGVKLYLSDEGGPDWRSEWALAGGHDLHRLHDGDRFRVGGIEFEAIHTPGHTPEHMSFVVTDRGSGAEDPIGMATGDFVFVGDLGRPDLLESAAGVVGAMQPSARALYRSLERFSVLDDHLQVWPAHGAGSACGKALGAVPSSTVGYEKRNNPAILASKLGQDVFVEEILSGQPEPPLYFSTMKRLNRQGPPLLGELPRPPQLGVEALKSLSQELDTVVIDARFDRREFMRGHLRGSLLAPLDKSFPSVVGSFVRPEEKIVLIVPSDRLEEAVRDLVRIGFDRIVGWSVPETLRELGRSDPLATLPRIDFSELEELRLQAEATVLDVRRSSEYEIAHIPEALNIAHTRLLDRLDEIPQSHRLLVHCQGGVRAAVASAMLARAGFEVLYVDDAFPRWQAKAATGP